MDIASVFRSNDSIDLLIVVDENDCLKTYMRRIKHALQLTRIKRIQHRSIFDFENENKINKCEKSLILLTSKTAAGLEDRWINELPKIRGDPSKYFVLYLQEGILQEGENKYRHQRNRYYARAEDVMKWWPMTLKFLFRKKHTSNKTASFEMRMTDSNADTPDVLEFKEQIENTIASENRRSYESAKTVILVCRSLNEHIESNIKDDLRSKKMDGCHVYVVSLHGRADISDDVKWISTNTYTRREIMIFLLHVFNRLELIEMGMGPIQTHKKPSPLVGPLKFKNPSLKSKSLLLIWPKPCETNDIEFITIQHRSNKDTLWKTIADQIAISTSSYKSSNLDVTNKHQFRMLRETPDGLSKPLTSRWFEWEFYVPKQAVLKVLLYIVGVISLIISIPQYLIAIPLNTITCCLYYPPYSPLPSKKEPLHAHCLLHGMIYIPAALTCLIVYGKNPNEPNINWLLIGGLYLTIWCIILHFILVVCFKQIHTLILPFYLLKKAYSLKFRKAADTDESSDQVRRHGRYALRERHWM